MENLLTFKETRVGMFERDGVCTETELEHWRERFRIVRTVSVSLLRAPAAIIGERGYLE